MTTSASAYQQARCILYFALSAEIVCCETVAFLHDCPVFVNPREQKIKRQALLIAKRKERAEQQKRDSDTFWDAKGNGNTGSCQHGIIPTFHSRPLGVRVVSLCAPFLRLGVVRCHAGTLLMANLLLG